MNRRVALWLWVALLALLHHDFWWWEDTTLVFGVFPVGLAWHVAYSLVTALTCFALTRHAWPERWERWADQPERPDA
jgi:hypothetical protein